MNFSTEGYTDAEELTGDRVVLAELTTKLLSVCWEAWVWQGEQP